MKQTALVTGASSGLGAEFARQLAARGDDLVLVARSVDKLEELARALRAEQGIRVEVIGQDLSQPDAAEQVAQTLDAKSISVDILVNNAGFGTAGRFERIDANRERDELMVNVVAMVGLTHALVPGMLRRRRGGVINIGSTGGFSVAPYLAVYGSSKTFVLNFSLALWSEFRGTGVKVLAVAPGPVETGFFDVVGSREVIVGGRPTTPQAVVSTALRAFARDRGYVVPGGSNFAMAHLMPRRPRKLMALVGRMVTRRVADALTPAGS